MDIINAHVHMIELEGMIKKYPNLEMPYGISVFNDISNILPMLHPEILLKQMNEAGISKSIIYAVEAPYIYASNEYVSLLCNKFPDRFIGFSSVNPKNPNAPAQLENAIKNLNLKGLKLHPPLQDFFPNDESIFPLYERANELDIPVVFHVGSTPFGSACKLSQANPLLIDDVAVNFPNLRILLTHLGTLWSNEAFMVVEKNPNVFIDTAAYLTEIPKILTKDIISRIGEDKIIFGTDYPMPYGKKSHNIKDFVDCIRNLDISKSIIEKILIKNINNFLYAKEYRTPITLQEFYYEISNATKK